MLANTKNTCIMTNMVSKNAKPINKKVNKMKKVKTSKAVMLASNLAYHGGLFGSEIAEPCYESRKWYRRLPARLRARLERQWDAGV